MESIIDSIKVVLKLFGQGQDESLNSNDDYYYYYNDSNNSNTLHQF